MSIITNKYNLCQAWVTAIQKARDEYDHAGDVSVTGLLKPHQVAILQARHDTEIVEDVMDLIPSFEGQMAHEILHRAATDEVISEQRFIVRFGGHDISLKPDWIEPKDHHSWRLRDFKNWKAYKFMYGQEDAIQQLNCYIHLMDQLQIHIDEAIIEARFKDWDIHEAMRNKRYPQSRIIPIAIPVWSKQMAEDFLLHRIGGYFTAMAKPDGELPRCSDNDRWASPDCFKIKNMTTGKTMPGCAKFVTLDDAKNAMELRNNTPKKKGNKPIDLTIEFVPGLSKRCDGSGDWSGCPCRPFCRQYQEEILPARRASMETASQLGMQVTEEE